MAHEKKYDTTLARIAGNIAGPIAAEVLRHHDSRSSWLALTDDEKKRISLESVMLAQQIVHLCEKASGHSEGGLANARTNAL